MYGWKVGAGVVADAVCSATMVADVAQPFAVSSRLVAQFVPVYSWYSRPTRPALFTARHGFLAFVIVRTSADQVWPWSVEWFTCRVQSVPAAPPTRSHQATQTLPELFGSTAMVRSAPRRSEPIRSFHLANRLVATRWPTAPSPESFSAPNGAAPEPQESSLVTTTSKVK